MAEKSSTKKKIAAKQELQTAIAEAQKDVQERRETELKPEERIEERAVRQAVATADAVSADSVAKDIGQLKSSVGRMLSQIAESLDAEVDKYRQVRKAIEAKEKELAEIYEIQKSAVTLVALIEAQQRKRDEFEEDMARRKSELEEEITTSRAAWDDERKMREAEIKEQQTQDAKRRERDRDEYQYKFGREQQQAKDVFADEKAKIERDLAVRREELERQLADREAAVAAREKELADLRERAARFPGELDAAVAKAVKDAVGRSQADAAGREELLKHQFAGEKNVLSTRITSLEQNAKDQAEQIKQLSAKLEKAYGQVQEVAVRAIEGASNSKTLAGVQQLLSEQLRKAETKA